MLRGSVNNKMLVNKPPVDHIHVSYKYALFLSNQYSVINLCFTPQLCFIFSYSVLDVAPWIVRTTVDVTEPTSLVAVQMYEPCSRPVTCVNRMTPFSRTFVLSVKASLFAL